MSPLFICDRCKCVENTALSMCSWGHKKHLCSECCPTQKKWHNRFPREFTMPKDEKDCFERLKFGGKQKGSGSAPFPSMVVIFPTPPSQEGSVSPPAYSQMEKSGIISEEEKQQVDNIKSTANHEESVKVSTPFFPKESDACDQSLGGYKCATHGKLLLMCRIGIVEIKRDARRQALEEKHTKLEETYRSAVMQHTNLETWDKIKKTIWELTKPV